MEKLTDNSPMPYGLHKGEPMTTIPAWYLLWLYDNKKTNTQVREYIEDNLDVLRMEAAKSQRK